MSRVFGVQSNMRRDGGGSWSPRFDLRPASEYGEIKFIFGHGNHQFSGEDLHQVVADSLRDFDEEMDFILPIGDTCLIGVVFRVIEEMELGPVKCLHWDGAKGGYDVIRI